MVNSYLYIVLLALFAAPAPCIQFGSTVDQLESMELLDEKMQDAVEFAQEAFEQFNYRYLHDHNY